MSLINGLPVHDRLRLLARELDDAAKRNDTRHPDPYAEAMREAADKLERITWLANGWLGKRGERIKEILNAGEPRMRVLNDLTAEAAEMGFYDRAP